MLHETPQDNYIPGGRFGTHGSLFTIIFDGYRNIWLKLVTKTQIKNFVSFYFSTVCS